jgi:putative FmdB family regulatory protein
MGHVRGWDVPRYDYQCESGHKYELQQPFGSPTEHDCQKCGKPARRIVTVAPPLVFKAGGYYKSSGRDFSSDSGSDGASTFEKRTSRKGSRSPSTPSSD